MNPDFKELLQEFNAQEVEYLIVGAHALAAHGHVRATKDLDVWVHADAKNAQRVIAALRAFGAPLEDLTTDDLSRPGVVFQIGVPPVRVDILTSVTDLEFEAAWKDRVDLRFGGIPVGVLSKQDLIRNKRATGRTQDLADVEWLEGPGAAS